MPYALLLLVPLLVTGISDEGNGGGSSCLVICLWQTSTHDLQYRTSVVPGSCNPPPYFLRGTFGNAGYTQKLRRMCTFRFLLLASARSSSGDDNRMA